MEAAKAPALSDDQRRDLMLPLVQQALATYGVTVRAAGESNTTQEDPADYVPIEEGVNFDVRLNSKRRIRGTAILDRQGGHSFTDRGRRYLVLGPRSLDPDGPDPLRFMYEHELYHVEHHLTRAHMRAARREVEQAPEGERAGIRQRQDADEELEAYADQFPRFFLRLGSVGNTPEGVRQYAGEQWSEMIERFEAAGEPSKRNALSRIETFYNGLGADERRILAEWLRRRERQRPGRTMVRQLATALGTDLTVAPPPNQ